MTQQEFAQTVAQTTKQYSDNVLINTVTVHNVTVKASDAQARQLKEGVNNSINTQYDPIQGMFVAVFAGKTDQLSFARIAKHIVGWFIISLLGGIWDGY